MLGLGQNPRVALKAPLAHDIEANGRRKHYCRATLRPEGLYIADKQDSSLLSILANANALVIRGLNAPPARAGDLVEYLPI
jgi:molybdopterin molybdotransferase